MDKNTSGNRIQLLTSFIINILALATGASFGIANVLISDLQSVPNNDSIIKTRNDSSYFPSITKEDIFSFHINRQESTWIASFGMIGQYFPILFVGPLVGRFGKRISMQVDCILFSIGFLLMGLSINVEMLYISKLFLGYAFLTSRSSIQPFTAEITDPNIRGFASTLWSMLFTIGQATSIFFAGMVGWRELSGFFAALMGVCFLVLFWPRETPEWLMTKLEFQNAVASYEFYKSDKKNIIEDSSKRLREDGTEKSYRELVKHSREETVLDPKFKIDQKGDTLSPTRILLENICSAKKILTSPEFYKPFSFLVVIFGLQELSGFAVLNNFSIVLVETYGYGSKTFVDAGTLVTIVALSRIPISMISAPILHKYKKRPIYLSVCVLLLLILSGIIAFTTLVEHKYLSPEDIQASLLLQSIPFVLLILFYACFSMGFGNIPFALMGELFPSNISNVGNTIVFVIVNSVGLSTVYTALLIKEKYGLQYVFVIPAISILLSLIWAAIFMPETHGLSLKQIRTIYSSKDSMDSNDRGNKKKSQEKIQQDKFKDELRKASLNLWSPDVCVTCMKMIDGEAAQIHPLQKIFLAAQAIIKIDDETTIPKHSKNEENIKKDHSMVKDSYG